MHYKLAEPFAFRGFKRLSCTFCAVDEFKRCGLGKVDITGGELFGEVCPKLSKKNFIAAYQNVGLLCGSTEMCALSSTP